MAATSRATCANRSLVVPPDAGELVQPGVVEVTGAKLLAVEQVEQEASIGGAAFDDHGGLGQGPPQPDERLAAVTTPADQLGDHGVEFGRDGVPLGHARVDSDTWPGGQSKQGDGPGDGREVVLGVLGVDPHLDGVAARGPGGGLRAVRPRRRGAAA